MSPDFDRIYSAQGRSSIPPEYLLKSLLLQVLFAIRSERLLLEQLDYNLLFRWFVGIGIDDATKSKYPPQESTYPQNLTGELKNRGVADGFSAAC